MVNKKVGVNLRHFTNKHYSEKVIRNYIDSLTFWCKWITSRFDTEIVFFPFCEEKHQSDIPAYDNLLVGLGNDCSTIRIYRYYKISDLRAEISQCDFFLGTRFHSVLLAAQQCVPVLAISYADKSYRFMADIELEEYVVKVEETSFQAIKNRWEKLCQNNQLVRSHLQVVKEKQRKLAHEHYDLVFNAICNLTIE